MPILTPQTTPTDRQSYGIHGVSGYGNGLCLGEHLSAPLLPTADQSGTASASQRPRVPAEERLLPPQRSRSAEPVLG